MKTCAQIAMAIHPYLDGELQTAEALQVEAHLMDCARCREHYEALLHVVGSIRAAHPLYTPPASLEAKVRREILTHRRRQWMRRGAIAAGVLLAVALAGAGLLQRNRERDPFAQSAIEAHLRYARGSLPLDIRSNDPQAVEVWLGARLPFRVSLPAGPGTARYSLIGARLYQYRDEDEAYVAYKINGEPASLLITSSAHNVPQGGEAQQIGRLLFHTSGHAGFEAVSWVDTGLTYALVSRAGAEACAVCHGMPSERWKYSTLKVGI